MERATVALPEGGSLALPIAGLGSRLWARVADGIIQVVLAGAVLLVSGALVNRLGWALPNTQVALATAATLGVLACAWLYPVAFELAWRGQTPGKRVMGLAVVDTQGRPPTVAAAVIRNVLRVVDWAPGFGAVGLFVAWNDPHHRRVGDWVAGTVVVDLTGQLRG